MQYRQGDVLIESVGRIPVGAAKQTRTGGRIVLAYGEATGHAHAILEETVTLYERDGTLFLRVGMAGAAVVHEEHATVTLPPGKYRVTRQREYHPQEIRRVSD